MTSFTSHEGFPFILFILLFCFYFLRAAEFNNIVHLYSYKVKKQTFLVFIYCMSICTSYASSCDVRISANLRLYVCIVLITNLKTTKFVLSARMYVVNFEDLNRHAMLTSQLSYVRAATPSNDATVTSAGPSEQNGSTLGTGAWIGIAFGAVILGMIVTAVILLGIQRLVDESKHIQKSVNH